MEDEVKKRNDPKPCHYRQVGRQTECSLLRTSLRCPDHEEDPPPDITVELTKPKKKRSKKK